MRINSHVALHKIALVRLLHFVIPIVAFTSVAFTTGAVLTLAHAGTPTYTTFAVEGAGTGDFLGTFPISIAPDGTVVGFFSKQTVDRAGLVRDPRGNITLIDAPNAGTARVGSAATATRSTAHRQRCVQSSVGPPCKGATREKAGKCDGCQDRFSGQPANSPVVAWYRF